MSLLDNLSQKDLHILSTFLEIRDLVNLSQVNRYLRSQLRTDTLWVNLVQGFLDTQNVVCECLQEAGLINFSPTKSLDDNELFSEMGRNQRLALNLLKVETLSCSNDLETYTFTQLEAARNVLAQFQTNNELDLLYKAAYVAFETILYQPTPSLHLLAFIAFALNSFPESSTLVSLGLEFDDSFEPLIELKVELDRLSTELNGDGKAPLLSNGVLSIQFKKVVHNIFQQYCIPGTQWMREQELSNFITVTNHGQAPPAIFVKHVFKAHATPNGFKNRPAMSKSDFEAFYLHLAHEDPQETREDLASHGFDPVTLLPLNAMNENCDSVSEANHHMASLVL